ACKPDLFLGIKRLMTPAVGINATIFSRARGSFCLALLIYIALSIGVSAQINTLPPASPTNNAVVMIQGTVQVVRVDQENWTPSVLNEVLYSGDHVRTGERSRALIYLAGGTTIKLDELTEVEIPPPKKTTFLKGLFEIFHRDRSKNNEFRLPGANAAIRGTDFIV